MWIMIDWPEADASQFTMPVDWGFKPGSHFPKGELVN